jgi:prevent-host-death family protein
MGRVWQLQEAKNNLSEVVAEAISNGPQVITRRGQEVAVVISAMLFRQLVANRSRCPRSSVRRRWSRPSSISVATRPLHP